MTVVVDTGPLLAAADRSDSWHERCRDLLTGLPGQLLVPVPVMVEVCYLLQSRLGPDAEAAFLESVVAGELTAVSTTPEDIRRASEFVRQYSDFPLGFVDASVLAVAERFGISEVATLDRRHFSAVRPGHTDTLVLLP